MIEELKQKIVLASFVIFTLLFGLSGIYSNFVAYADDDYEDDDNDYEDRTREAQEKRDELKREAKEKRDELKREAQEKRDEIKREAKEKRDELKREAEKHRDEFKAQKKEIKNTYKNLKKDYREQYKKLHDELKNQVNEFKKLKRAELASSDSGTIELTEEQILQFEEKRIKLQELKKQFRENILEIKTKAKRDISDLKQTYQDENEDRKNKLKVKLSTLKQKYADRIKDKSDLSSGIIDGEVVEATTVICHIPPGNPDNAHSIKVSINSLRAHMAHYDTLGECGQGIVLDDNPTDETDSDEIRNSAELNQVPDGIASGEIKTEVRDDRTKISVEVEDVPSTPDSDDQCSGYSVTIAGVTVPGVFEFDLTTTDGIQCDLNYDSRNTDGEIPPLVGEVTVTGPNGITLVGTLDAVSENEDNDTNGDDTNGDDTNGDDTNGDDTNGDDTGNNA